jgi:hypothetical protein
MVQVMVQVYEGMDAWELRALGGSLAAGLMSVNRLLNWLRGFTVYLY